MDIVIWHRDEEPEDERPQPMTAKEWIKILEENDETEEFEEEEELLETMEEDDSAEDDELDEEDGEEPPTRETKKYVCTICMTNDRKVVFMPCSHFVTCKMCSESCNKCPVCRAGLMGKLEVFL